MEHLLHQDIISFLTSHIKAMFSAAIILTVGLILAQFAKSRLRIFFRHRHGDPTIKLFVVNVLYGAILIVLTTIVLGQLGVPTASLVALIGAASIAVALALQSSLSNIASGILLIFLQPFRIGDVVELAGVFGTIDQINLFTTRIKTPNNESVYLPNNKVMSDKMINKAYKGLRRLDLAISIAYNADIKKAKSIIMKLIENDERFLSDPAPKIIVKSLADSAVVLAVRPWAHKENYASALYALQENTKLAFNEHEIPIPFPQLDVHLNNVN